MPPLSQNGFDNGGICGVCKWSQTPEEVEFVLSVLEKLAQRYGHRDGLLGITPINEPITDPTWTALDVPHRYPAVDKDLAKGSGPNTLAFLRQFYTDAYARIRPHLAADKYVIFHDGFRLKDWKEFFLRSDFSNVMLDTHQYLMNAENMGCEQTPEGYLRFIQEVFARDIAEVQEYVPVICGEWCLFNSYAVGMDTKGGQTVLNGIDFSQSQGLSAEEKQQVYRQLADAQLAAWHKGSGYFYWSYKLLLDTVNEPNWMGWDCWDLGKSVDQGWFPPQP